LGARALGRAGATAGSQLTHDALFQNPASAAFEKRYALHASYLGYGNGLTASVVDTKTSPVGGGLYYMRRDIKGDATKNPSLGNYNRLEERAGSAVMGRLAENFAVGLTAKYTYLRPYDNRVKNGVNWNVDAGLRYLFSPQFAVGVVGQNFLTDEKGANPRLFSFGIEYQPTPSFVISAQAMKTSELDDKTGMSFPKKASTLGWSAGAEYRYSGFAARTGYVDHGPWNHKLLSFGLGYEDAAFALDYAFQMVTSGRALQIHTVGLSAFL